MLRKFEKSEEAVANFIKTTEELDEKSLTAAICLLVDIVCEERGLDKAEFAQYVCMAVSICNAFEGAVEE